MLSVEIWDPTETFKYPSIEDEIEGLTFGTLLGVGFSTFDFTVKRSPRFAYGDLALTNIAVIRDGKDVAWKGDIACRGVEAAGNITMPVECDGLGARLITRATTASFGNEDLTTWVADHLLTDSDLGYSEGRIDTGDDYTFPYGIDIGAGTTGDYFAGVLEKGNKANGWFYGVWEDGFYLHPYPTTADYEVEAGNAKYSLRYTIEDIVNYLRVSYTVDGSIYKYFWWPSTGPDATSKALYGRRDGTLAVQGKASLAQAEQMATVFLDEHKRMRPQSSFEVTEVTSVATGQVVPLSKVRAGKVIHIKGIYPTAHTPAQAQVINELSTFEIAQTSCEISLRGHVKKCTISPGTMGLMMDKMLARIEARQQ